MGFRFRKRIRVLPGVHLNISKRGVSTSIGGKGLTVNLRGDKIKTTASLPGSGLSYSGTHSIHPESEQGAPAKRSGIPVWLWVLLVIGALVVVAKLG